MPQIKLTRPLFGEHVKTSVILFRTINRLNLSKTRKLMKELVNFWERFDFCRFHNDFDVARRYNYSCRHTESAPNHIAES